MNLKTDDTIYSDGRIYIVGDTWDFAWKQDEVELFRHMWNNGLSIVDMARAFKRDTKEVFILALDLAERGKIKVRENGIFGNRRPTS